MLKTKTPQRRHGKAGRLTLGEARRAARVAKAGRPGGTFVQLGTARADALIRRYLGHFGPPVRRTGPSSDTAGAIVPGRRGVKKAGTKATFGKSTIRKNAAKQV